MNDEMKAKLAKYMNADGTYNIRAIAEGEHIDLFDVIFGGTTEDGDYVPENDMIAAASKHNDEMAVTVQREVIVPDHDAKPADFDPEPDEPMKIETIEFKVMPADVQPGDVIVNTPVDGSKIDVGTLIRVKNHTRYQSLKNGAVISPTIAHERNGYNTTVRAIYKDEMEDENGKPVVEYQIEAETGELFKPEEIEIDVLAEVVTVSEAAKDFDVTDDAVRKACQRNGQSGGIRCRKSGNTYLILRADAKARWGKK